MTVRATHHLSERAEHLEPGNKLYPLVREVLETTRSPSGTNIQPRRVHVAAGVVRDQLVQEVLAHRETSPPDDIAEFPRTKQRKEPYTSRSPPCLWSLLKAPPPCRSTHS